MRYALALLLLLSSAPPANQYVLHWTSDPPANYVEASSSIGFDPWNRIALDGRSGELAVDSDRACLTIYGRVWRVDGTKFEVSQSWVTGCGHDVYLPIMAAR